MNHYISKDKVLKPKTKALYEANKIFITLRTLRIQRFRYIFAHFKIHNFPLLSFPPPIKESTSSSSKQGPRHFLAPRKHHSLVLHRERANKPSVHTSTRTGNRLWGPMVLKASDRRNLRLRAHILSCPVEANLQLRYTVARACVAFALAHALLTPSVSLFLCRALLHSRGLLFRYNYTTAEALSSRPQTIMSYSAHNRVRGRFFFFCSSVVMRAVCVCVYSAAEESSWIPE